MGIARIAILMPILAGVLAGQPKIGPDEFRTSSEAYVPPPPPNTLRTEVKLVEVPVVVRDSRHHAVAGLKPDDFQVFDGGKQQAITMFSVETAPAAAAPDAKTPEAPAATAPASAPDAPAVHPRFIALCFDDVSSTFADLRYTKTAAEKFVRTGLAPGDRVAVFTTASASSTVTFTDEVPKLIENIEKVSPHPRFSDNDASQCPRITAYQAYLIDNHMDNQTLMGVAQEDMACKNLRMPDAIQDVTATSRMIWEHAMSTSRNTLYSIDGLVTTLAKLPGRRMLLLASSGFLTGNLESVIDDMTSKALHAEVVINTLDSKGLYALTPGRPIDAPAPRGRSVRTQIAEASIQSRQEGAKDDGMAALALGTGGAFYHNSNDFDKGFRELGSIPDVVYVLGFSPSDAPPDGRYHSLKVKLPGGHHYALQSRMGYSAPSKTPPEEHRKPTRLDSEALATDTLDEVPVRIGWRAGQPENGSPSLQVAIHLDVGKMKFTASADRHSLKLTYILAVMSQTGSFIAGRQGEIEMAFKQATFDALAPDGLNVLLPFHAPPGSYTLRGIVQEGLEGKISAASVPVEFK